MTRLLRSVCASMRTSSVVVVPISMSAPVRSTVPCAPTGDAKRKVSSMGFSTGTGRGDRVSCAFPQGVKAAQASALRSQETTGAGLGAAASGESQPEASNKVPAIETPRHSNRPCRLTPDCPGFRLNDRMLIMAHIILFNKPYGVLSQFTPEGRWKGLRDFISLPGVYPAGRLDADSEGLLLLTDHGPWQERIADPRYKLEKTYWAQVEGQPGAIALEQLTTGVVLSDFTTRPAKARLIDSPPGLWSRDPPIRFRASIPTAWIELRISEGKNRQVRRMCAAIGFPVLRLVRSAIGPFELGIIPPGESVLLDEATVARFGFLIGKNKKSSQSR